MNIGDRVRLLHGKEEGIIRRIIDHKTVEVEIEEGFLIPVLKNELVTIAQEESDRFKNEIKPEIKPGKVEKSSLLETQSGIYLAVEMKDLEIYLWLINHTDDTVLFSVHAFSESEYRGLSYGTLRKYTYSKIDAWNLKDQDRWPLLLIDAISFQEKGRNPNNRISRQLAINKKYLLKKKEKAPLLNQDAALIPLSEEMGSIDPVNLKNAFFPELDEKLFPKDLPEINKDEVVDLHIETLINDFEALSKEEILKIQMDHFVKKLDDALIRNLRSITFIHGIGSGILRNKIHKFLGQYPHIQYFEDARKDKFGYGATKVFLK